MRHTRLFVPLLLAALLGMVAGCGGGSGSGISSGKRKVTIQITWPSATKKASRVALSSIGSALVEVYDGSTRIGAVKLSAPTQGATLSPSTATLDLPTKGLTFFANAFAAPTSPDYVTNPANGQLEKGTPGALIPLAPVDAGGNSSDARAVAHAVAAVDVATLLPPPNAPAQAATVNFTWNNAIASLVPTTTTLTLDRNNPNVDLANLIQAKSADGYNLFLATGALQAINDPADTLGALRAGFVPGTTLLNLKISGTVRVIVSDSQVNSGNPAFQQTPIQTAITYDIVPPAAVNTTLNTGGGSSLLPTLPYYARSVRFTLHQTPVTDPGPNQILDSPPADIAVVQPTTFTAPATITVNGSLVIPYVYSGRDITLTAEARSNADGTGAILASGQKTYTANTAPLTPTTQEIALTLKVTGFTLTPANPTITLVNPSNGSLTPSLNTVNLQVTAIVPNVADPLAAPSLVAVDPHTLNVGAFIPLVAPPTLSPAATAVAASDASGNYVLVTGLQNGTAQIGVSDKQNNSIGGSTTLTVQYAQGGVGLTIH